MGRAVKIEFTNPAVLQNVKREEWHDGPFTAVRYTYSPGAVFPEHAHGAAQLTIVLSGRIVFKAEGRETEVGPGETFFLAGGTPHGARVPADSPEVVSLNIFTPPRKDHP